MKKEKRGSKKAQFYLIAALIIIVLIVGFASISNYIKVKEKPKKFYDLSGNINLEGADIIKYSIYSKQNTDKVIQNFTEIFQQYIEATGEESDLIIITGDENNITVRTINSTNQGQVSISLGGTLVTVYEAQEKEIKIKKYSGANQNIQNITINLPNNVTQTFSLKPGQNFIFVLTKSSGFESYIEAKD